MPHLEAAAAAGNALAATVVALLGERHPSQKLARKYDLTSFGAPFLELLPPGLQDLEQVVSKYPVAQRKARGPDRAPEASRKEWATASNGDLWQRYYVTEAVVGASTLDKITAHAGGCGLRGRSLLEWLVNVLADVAADAAAALLAPSPHQLDHMKRWQARARDIARRLASIER